VPVRCIAWARSYYLFAKSLFDLPDPRELTEDEKIIYRAELDDRRRRSGKGHRGPGRALKLAHKNHVYNEWSRKSAAFLVKFPPKFPVLEDAGEQHRVGCRDLLDGVRHRRVDEVRGVGTAASAPAAAGGGHPHGGRSEGRAVMRRAQRFGLVCALTALAAACGGGPTVPDDKDPEKDPTGNKTIASAPPVVQEGFSADSKAEFDKGVAALGGEAPNFTEAAEAFEKATAASPKFQAGWLNLAFAYERLGRYTDAVGAYRKLVALKVIDARVSLALGRSLLLAGEPELAITEFESVLRKDETSLQARNNLAAAYLAKGDAETALRYVKEVLSIQPKNVPAVVNLGLLYLRQKKLDLAQLMFEKALGYDDKDARARNNLGLTYYAKNTLPLAVLEWRKAIGIDPTMDDARLNLAAVYLDYLHYEAALEQFRAVRARFPKNYQAMVGEANSLYGTGDYAGAVKLYEDSLSLDARNTEVLLRAGKIFEEQLAKPDRALEFYEKFIAVENPPADAPIRATVQFLKQMRDNPPPKAPEGETPPAGDAPAVEGGEAAPVAAPPAAAGAPGAEATPAAPAAGAPPAAPASSDAGAAPAGEAKPAAAPASDAKPAAAPSGT
jgi:tetratricopeptide (TPR) repeat protein